MKTTFDTNTKEGKIKAFNGKQSANGTLKDLKSLGEVRATDIMTYDEQKIEDGSEKTDHVTVLFLEDGAIFGGISATVQDTASGMIDLLQGIEHTGSFTLKVGAQQSKAGREFLNLQLVSLD